MSSDENNDQLSTENNGDTEPVQKDDTTPKEFNTDSLLNFTITKAERKKDEEED
ncbi:MAG: hypothetical protein WBB69_16275 [Anaerolineales bacterium]